MSAYVTLAIDPERGIITKAQIAGAPSSAMTSMDGEVWTQWGPEFKGPFNEAIDEALRAIVADPRMSRIFCVLRPQIMLDPQRTEREMQSTKPHFGPFTPTDICYHDWRKRRPYGDGGPIVCINCNQRLYPDKDGNLTHDPLEM